MQITVFCSGGVKRDRTLENQILVIILCLTGAHTVNVGVVTELNFSDRF